jgi:hypothetical protein
MWRLPKFAAALFVIPENPSKVIIAGSRPRCYFPRDLN